MNRILWIFVILNLSLTTYAQDKKNPDFEFSSTLYDFGVMKKGSNAECVFTVTNKSQTPLIITSVKASCGCTVPSYPKKPVLPGESADITVKYNTSTVGQFNKSINVYTNLQKDAVVLTIKGEVVK